MAEVKPVLPPNIRALSDSLIEACYRSFGLSDSIGAGTAFGVRAGAPGKTYRQFQQGWPDQVPLIVFAKRLSEAASRVSGDCDCLESPRGGWLECQLKFAGITGGVIRLEAGRETKLAGREFAIIIDNLWAVKKDDITRLIRAGYTFGYFSSLDHSVPDDLRKLFSRAGVTPILSLPAGKDGWLKLAQNYRLIKGSGKVKRPSAFEFDRAMVTETISRQPGAKAFTLDFSGGSDPDIIDAVLGEARKAKIPYILNEDSRVPLDSLALAKGLKVMRFAQGEKGSAPEEIRNDFLSRIISEPGQWQKVIYLDGTQIDTDKLMRLKEIMNRLGIRVRPCLKLARAIE